MAKLHLRIGTRSSPLALWQAEHIKGEMLKFVEVGSVELVKIKTTGDKILDVPLAKVGGKGLFTKEIEEAMLREEIDLAVHSMKDVPTAVPEGLEVAIITKRENPLDSLVSRGVAFRDLPQGARIGTSSLRRKCQLLRVRPDFRIVDVRGNVQTRLKKMESGKWDAVILAAAGMIRLGYENDITELLDPAISLPAVGQGALALETRAGNEEVNAIVRRLHHQPSAICVEAERAFLGRLGGGCQVPIGAYGVISGETLILEGLVSDLAGKRYFRETIAVNPAKRLEAGVRLAETLLRAGAEEVLAEFYA
ncbi:MAG: hydroxymethylbilane synthase [Nitrospinae bacterium]|nr:hydroxymethylbilane synthase [Nitrospinota bacterium]